MNITKETFLRAEDPKNRDAMLYDMLAGIAENIKECKEIKEDVDGFKAQVSLLKRLFIGAVTIFTAISAWLAKN